METLTDKKIWVVIPAYNEEKVVGEVISEVKNSGYENIIVVDDGSADKTHKKANELIGEKALRHRLNRGKGAATKTGIEAAKLLGAEIIVTMDGDGQHDSADIGKLIRPIVENKTDVVLGSRLKNSAGMPWYKIWQNKIGNIITWFLYGLYVSDSQSGMRAYSARSARLIETRADRYEYESQVIREIYLNKLKFVEVPIAVRYTEYSMGKVQKQSFSNGLKTVYRMIWNMIN